MHAAAGQEAPATGKPDRSGTGRLRVFISYSRDDFDFADQLVAALELTGFDVAIDRHGITGGEDFQRRLGALIRETDTVVFVLSPSSVQSGMCAWEVDEAVRLGKRIIPVVCRGLESRDPPPHLKNLDYVFFYTEPKVAGSGFGHGLSRLVAALNTDLDWMREHTRLLARASEWEAAGHLENRMLSGADIAAAKDWASKRPKGAPEPTALHLEYIRASEDAETARTSAERKRLEEIASAQAEREKALKSAETAQQEKEKASRRLVQRTMIGTVLALILAAAASAAGLVAWSNQRTADDQRQRAERNLVAITQALTVLDKETSPKQVAESFFNLAHTYLDQDRFSEAITLYKRSLAIVEKQPGDQGAELAALRGQLGIVYAKVGKPGEAEPLLKDALSYYERTGNREHPNVGAILALLTDLYKSQGREADAAAIAEKSRSIALASEAFEIPVFFATDRAEEPNPNRLDYSSSRGRKLDIGQAIVTVPKQHELSRVERPWAVRIPYIDVSVYEQAEDPRLHFTIEKLTRLPEAEFLAAAKDRLTAASKFKDHAFVFVHGFNMSFDNTIFRAAQLAFNLQFDGPVFVYSWPSGGKVASYTYDAESSEQAAPYLGEFLRHIKNSGATSISIVAHSMGCKTVLRVLREFAAATPPEVTIDQLILATPDIDREAFQQIAPLLKGITKGITVYASSNDRALLVSRTFWGHPRAGEVLAEGPVVVGGVDTIDVTGVGSTSVAGYTAGAPDDLLSDMRALLLTGIRPPDKRMDRFVAVESPSGRYWRYKP